MQGQAACVPLFSICRATGCRGSGRVAAPERGKCAGLDGVRPQYQLAAYLPVHPPALDRAHLSAADIQSVACCSMREGIVLYDRNGEAIWACANVDARASREVAELKEIHDNQFESEVYDVSGQTRP